LIAAHPAINACFKTVDCWCLDYFVWQSVPQICCSFEEEIFSVLSLSNFFEIFEAVTFHLVSYDVKTIAFVHFIYAFIYA
jgi:hypothetical protein